MPRMSRSLRLGGASSIVIAVICAGFTPASAADSEPHADEIAQLLDQVRPGEVTNDRVTPGTSVDMVENSDAVAVPATSAGELTVIGSSGVPISMVLPGVGTGATIAPDGTVVYGEEAGVTIAVQSDQGEARVHTVMEDAQAVDDVEYVFPGLTPELNSDGSVTLFATSDDGGIQLSVGQVMAPWAADAEGNDLATEYRVEGNSVIQEVAVDENTAYPVASDPSIDGDCGIVTCTLRFNRAYTKKIRDFNGDYGLVAAAVGAGVGLIGGPAGTAAGAIGGAIVGAKANIFSTQAGDFYANGNCFGVKMPAGVLQAGWGTQVTRGQYNCA